MTSNPKTIEKDRYLCYTIKNGCREDESKDIRLNGHKPDDGSDLGISGKVRIILVGILRNKELFAVGRSERDLN